MPVVRVRFLSAVARTGDVHAELERAASLTGNERERERAPLIERDPATQS